jgi:hypothetical protein
MDDVALSYWLGDVPRCTRLTSWRFNLRPHDLDPTARGGERGLPGQSLAGDDDSRRRGARWWMPAMMWWSRYSREYPTRRRWRWRPRSCALCRWGRPGAVSLVGWSSACGGRRQFWRYGAGERDIGGQRMRPR